MVENRNTVQSLERAFTILEALAQEPEGIPLTELANRIGLHKSTVHRLLQSLADLGYVQNQENGGKYRLTLKLLELSGRLTDNIDVLAISRPYLEKLRNAVEETVHLVVRDGTGIVYIFKAESKESSFRMFSRIGMRREMYCTAAGKSILATLPDREIARIWQQSEIKAYTDHTITSLEALLQELSTVRAQGFAVDNEENELGVRCVAVALRDYSGQSSAAFSISSPLVRMPDDRMNTLAEAALSAGRQISAELGWRGEN